MAWAPGIAPSRGVLETLQVTRPSAHINKVERGPGVAPGLSGWKPDVLLLNTTRAWWSHRESHPDLRRAKATCCSYHHGPHGNWRQRQDSHLRITVLRTAPWILGHAAVDWWGCRDLHPVRAD